MAKRKHRFFNTYLTATVSVALVLFLVGLECVIGLSATSLLDRVRENTTLTVVLSDETTASDSLRITRLLNVSPFCKSLQYVSKEDALQQHIADLGEDPTEFLGYNPIRAAFEINLNAAYVQQDSLLKAEELLRKYEFVEDITYPRVIVGFFSKNVSTILWVMLAVALVLLLISVVLIVNTIRLTVYSRRFIIHTMKLVGATPWIIKGPIVRKSMFMGVVAALIAMVLVAGVVYYIYYGFGMWIFPLTWQNGCVVVAAMLLAGLLLTFLASTFAVNRYIRMKTDDLYFV